MNGIIIILLSMIVWGMWLAPNSIDERLEYLNITVTQIESKMEKK